MSKSAQHMELVNTLIFNGLDANPSCIVKLVLPKFHILNTITMKNQVTMTSQEYIQFMDWRRENCVGFKTQCTQYKIDFESIQGLMNYYIKEYMSDVIEFNGIRFESISKMEDYIEAFHFDEYLDIVAEAISQGRISAKEAYQKGIKIGRRFEKSDRLQEVIERERFFDDDEDYGKDGLLDGED